MKKQKKKNDFNKYASIISKELSFVFKKEIQEFKLDFYSKLNEKVLDIWKRVQDEFAKRDEIIKKHDIKLESVDKILKDHKRILNTKKVAHTIVIVLVILYFLINVLINMLPLVIK